jgi:hypothetical protein
VRFFCLIGQKRAAVPNEEKPGLFYLLETSSRKGKKENVHKKILLNQKKKDDRMRVIVSTDFSYNNQKQKKRENEKRKMKNEKRKTKNEKRKTKTKNEKRKMKN